GLGPAYCVEFSGFGFDPAPRGRLMRYLGLAWMRKVTVGLWAAHLWAVGLLILGGAAAVAETDPPAYLVADEILYQDDGTLVAQGNVDIIQGDTRLRATRVTYSRDGDRLQIEGPLRLTDGAGMVVLSDSAELDRGFRNGLLRGARLLLDGQLQLAAADARRANGNTTQLRRVVATSCKVCKEGRPPIWQIRARRVLHDEDAQMLYFQDAQLRILDVPVVYLPRLRLPDPTLKRARGFLIPELQSSTLLGFGLKMPYFIPMGDHADLTVSPVVSNVTRTLDFRLRRAFARGDISAKAALSQDSLQSGLRGYLFADGTVDLTDSLTLDFDLEVTSDAAYLNDYDYSSKDRLDSALRLTQVTKDQYNTAAIIHFQTLRATEGNATQPTVVTDLTHETTTKAPWSQGVLRFGAEMRGHLRTSQDDIDGRDMWRMHANAQYLEGWTLPYGLRLGIETNLAADYISTRQDSTSDSKVSQITPAATLTLRC
ncbi:MAG: LPS-assembly protein LptD, partial [Paracoccaceae bacterium]